MNAENFSDGLFNVLFALDKAGGAMSGTLGGVGGVGWYMLGIFAGIAIAWSIIQSLIGSEKNFVASALNTFLTWAILASLIGGWTTNGAGLTSQISVQKFFIDYVPSITEKFTNDPSPTTTVVTKFADSIAKVITMKTSEKNESDNRDGVEKALTLAADIGTLGLHRFFNNTGPSWLTDATQYVFVQLLLLVSGAYLVWSLVSFVFMLNVGQLMLYIGLGLGPFLIPFRLFKPLSFLFDNWIKFMIGASFLKITAILVAILCLGTIDKVVGYTNEMANQSDSFVFLGLMIIFYSMLARQMMDRADNMALALAGGGSSVGGSGIFAATAGSVAAGTAAAGRDIFKSGGKAMDYAKRKFSGGDTKKTTPSGGNRSPGAVASVVGDLATTATGGGVPAAVSAGVSAMSSVRSKMAAARLAAGRGR